MPQSKKQKTKEQKIKKNNQNLQFQNNYRQHSSYISVNTPNSPIVKAMDVNAVNYKKQTSYTL